ncbi:Rcs stress response system protein RcsF [Shimwellia blattae]|uniref:Outer membrane lipoprotein RcsF n=1 Tax=Shimwellia blattae (strain ATCC 29907 / DSM 4481 / JCM 1650 / NBRC 105725 / CDC 9005-74) TaxID=630626 RepID=I2BCH5_SHIBC|nr:Rcs stress response system protein RcsF [Shimwellia blattae]AFJ48229.1 regulator of colanic acid synthesis [Shimwellia blattae DSM 4481 = NBRC 105725]GAB80924.1 lipoprotein RcsF [Shimwellia blattae DSM 4481 = NBRC 105725]VDY65724.1 outer membrane lipoprotein [Shimwellia blattae]VEC25521.1 outer membrane lipoprotein [Shimwellia blattae]
MRALPICVLAFALSGCSILSRSPVEPAKSPQPPAKATQPSQPKTTTHYAPVHIYTKAEELVGKPFRDLGEVSGDSCQVSNQDSPPNIPTARKRMQINAAKMRANAVLQHSCEITSGTPGCYRQAICLGSALKVGTK